MHLRRTHAPETGRWTFARFLKIKALVVSVLLSLSFYYLENYNPVFYQVHLSDTQMCWWSKRYKPGIEKKNRYDKNTCTWVQKHKTYVESDRYGKLTSDTLCQNDTLQHKESWNRCRNNPVLEASLPELLLFCSKKDKLLIYGSRLELKPRYRKTWQSKDLSKL